MLVLLVAVSSAFAEPQRGGHRGGGGHGEHHGGHHGDHHGGHHGDHHGGGGHHWGGNFWQ